MNDIDVTSAHEQASQDATLLDVREPAEWFAGHAPEAVHVPLSALAQTRLDPDATYLVICRSGARSAMAAGALSRAGYAARNVAGGMLAWAQRGLPMQSEDGSPPRVLAH